MWPLTEFQTQLDAAIKHFLDCTCGVTLQWFNKPKFHVILHLPAHIRRFGPAMLFATEGFESFNAIIRSASVHSNRHAPSLDIAARMAKGNRVRHLLNQGFFPANRDFQPPPLKRPSKSLPKDHPSNSPPKPPSESPWMAIPLEELKRCTWTQAGQAPLEFMGLNSFGSQLLGWEKPNVTEVSPGVCEKVGPVRAWLGTKSSAVGVRCSAPQVFTPGAVTLINGDTCAVGDWVVWVESRGQLQVSRIGCVAEIIQIVGSAAQQTGAVDFVLLSRTIIGEGHDLYKMRRLEPIPNEYCRVEIKVNLCQQCSKNSLISQAGYQVYCQYTTQLRG